MSNDSKIEIKDIPIMPQVATKILQLQEDNLTISFKDLEKVIQVDPALTAKILKVANSALYARQKEITNLQQGITLLGFKMVKSMVLLVCASNMYKKTPKNFSQDLDVPESLSSSVNMWHHLVLTAFIARQLAISIRAEDLKEDAFIAGLLHDIGRMVFLLNFEDRYRQFLERVQDVPDVDFIALEEEIFGFNHCEAGKLVFQKWNFPDEYVDVAFHHHSEFVDSPFDRLVKIVGIANIYAKIVSTEPLNGNGKLVLDAYKKSLSVSEEVENYILNNFLDEIKDNELFHASSNIV